MKKIVSILAATAMAASVFAVDFTAGFQLKGDLLNVDKDGNVKALNVRSENGHDDKPFVFSASGDKAGAQIKFADKEGGVVKADQFNMWFKPFDALKIELGKSDFSLNTEHVTWWKGRTLNTGAWGYKATFAANGLTIGAGLFTSNAGDSYWFSKPKSGDSAIAETAFYAEYAADFGTIKVLFDGKENFKKYGVGAGYNNTFGNVGIFADFSYGNGVVGFNGGRDTNKAGKLIAADADVQFTVDAFKGEVYAGFLMNLDNKKDNMDVPVYAKFTYALDGVTPYVKFQDATLLTKDFISEINIGAEGNIGAIAYDISAQINTLEKGKVGFSVPTQFRFSF